MDEIPTLAQICERFPSEWVLIDEPQTDEYLQVESGRVVFHSSDRDEFDRSRPNCGPG